MTFEHLARIVEERLTSRFYGKYEGVVTDVDDPLHIGRLRAYVPAVLGENVKSGWALPCAPFGGGKDRGFLFVPEQGDTVWIEFAAGDPSRPIWTGTFWGAPDSAGQQDDLATQTGSELPTADGSPGGPGRQILRTRAGHRILLDDDGELVVVTNGNEKTEIRLTKAGGVVIKGDAIKIGDGASEPLVLGNQLMQLFNTHIHATGVGPTDVPKQPMSSSHLSAKHKVE